MAFILSKSLTEQYVIRGLQNPSKDNFITLYVLCDFVLRIEIKKSLLLSCMGLVRHTAASQFEEST